MTERVLSLVGGEAVFDLGALVMLEGDRMAIGFVIPQQSGAG